MTLKHSNRAKWARKQHVREHRDPAVRARQNPLRSALSDACTVSDTCNIGVLQTQQALSEHHNMKTKLRQRAEEEGSESDTTR